MRTCALFILLSISLSAAFALEPADRSAIQGVIQDYTDSWNIRQGKGFADGYTDNADFVNIFGMKFSGRAEIEERHQKIIQTFFKGSTLEILDTQLREVQTGLVIATILWRLKGFRNPGSDTSVAGETREGVYTQVFINLDKKWKITAAQNTLIPPSKS